MSADWLAVYDAGNSTTPSLYVSTDYISKLQIDAANEPPTVWWVGVYSATTTVTKLGTLKGEWGSKATAAAAVEALLSRSNTFK